MGRIERIDQLRRNLDLEIFERLHKGKELLRIDLDVGVVDATPDRNEIRVVRRRLDIPRQDRADERQVIDETELLGRVDLSRDGVLETLRSRRTLWDVIGREALHALVLPRRAAVERDVEPHVFRRAGRADVPSVARWLLDENDRLEAV